MFSHLGIAVLLALIATEVPIAARAQNSSSVTVLPQESASDPAVPTKPLTIFDHDYPVESLVSTEQGKVTLNLLVGAQGHVGFAQKLSSNGADRLDQAAVQIARTRWQFQPGPVRSVKV